jgi:hypothetical protein
MPSDDLNSPEYDVPVAWFGPDDDPNDFPSGDDEEDRDEPASPELIALIGQDPDKLDEETT